MDINTIAAICILLLILIIFLLEYYYIKKKNNTNKTKISSFPSLKCNIIEL